MDRGLPRRRARSGCPSGSGRRSGLGELTREYSLSEIADHHPGRPRADARAGAQGAPRPRGRRRRHDLRARRRQGADVRAAPLRRSRRARSSSTTASCGRRRWAGRSTSSPEFDPAIDAEIEDWFDRDSVDPVRELSRSDPTDVAEPAGVAGPMTSECIRMTDRRRGDRRHLRRGVPDDRRAGDRHGRHARAGPRSPAGRCRATRRA